MGLESAAVVAEVPRVLEHEPVLWVVREEQRCGRGHSGVGRGEQ